MLCMQCRRESVDIHAGCELSVSFTVPMFPLIGKSNFLTTDKQGTMELGITLLYMLH